MTPPMDIWKNLADCTVAYNEAVRLASQYRGAETNALNKLNDAQKAVDAFVDEQKKAAPRSSDWEQTKRRKVLIP